MDKAGKSAGEGASRLNGVGHWRRAGALAVILAFAAIAAFGEARAADGRDQAIVAELHLMNEHQVALADLGSTRAGRESVQSVAMALSEDHRAATRELLAYAEVHQMNMSAVDQPGADRPLHGPLAFDELRTAPMARFDYEYLTRVIADQQAAADELTSARAIAHDPQLVALIDAELPAMRIHLAQAQAALANVPEPAPRTPTAPVTPTPPL